MKKNEKSLRIDKHPILGPAAAAETVTILYNGQAFEALRGESVAAALSAAGIRTFRYTHKSGEPRGLFCAVGRCTDCIMQVDGVPNVRTCVTEVREGMTVETQHGRGSWRIGHE